MPEEKKDKSPKTFEELKKKVDAEKKVSTQKVIRQIATREKLERDFKEDLLER